MIGAVGVLRYIHTPKPGFYGALQAALCLWVTRPLHLLFVRNCDSHFVSISVAVSVSVSVLFFSPPGSIEVGIFDESLPPPHPPWVSLPPIVPRLARHPFWVSFRPCSFHRRSALPQGEREPYLLAPQPGPESPVRSRSRRAPAVRRLGPPPCVHPGSPAAKRAGAAHVTAIPTHFATPACLPVAYMAVAAWSGRLLALPGICRVFLMGVRPATPLRALPPLTALRTGPSLLDLFWRRCDIQSPGFRPHDCTPDPPVPGHPVRRARPAFAPRPRTLRLSGRKVYHPPPPFWSVHRPPLLAQWWAPGFSFARPVAWLPPGCSLCAPSFPGCSMPSRSHALLHLRRSPGRYASKFGNYIKPVRISENQPAALPVPCGRDPLPCIPGSSIPSPIPFSMLAPPRGDFSSPAVTLAPRKQSP